MLDYLFFIISTSLFDGLSTTQQVIIFALLLATERPVANAFSFAAGLSLSYFILGLISLLEIDKLNVFFSNFINMPSQISDPVYYKLQLIIGIICFISGFIYLIYKKLSKKSSAESRLLGRLKKINPVICFIIGAFITISCFPVSIPYLGTIEKLAHSNLIQPYRIVMIAVYNFIYILPMLVIYPAYRFLRAHVEDWESKLHIHINRWNIVLTFVLLSGMGFLFIIDSTSFYLLSHPLMKAKFLW